jgi:hypothetical protein
MAEDNQRNPDTSREVLQTGKEVLQNEGDINGQLKERLKTLQKVIKAHDDINAKIRASEELGKDLKELDLDIYKNLRERVKIQDQLNQLESDNPKIVEVVQKKREELQKTLIQEQYVQKELNKLKNGLVYLEGEALSLQKLKVQSAEESLSFIQASIESQRESVTTEEAMVMALQESLELNQKTNAALEARQIQEALIAKRMGITGNLIKGSYGILNKLGIGSFMNLAAVTQKMQLAAQDGASRLKILGIGVKATFEAIGDALTDPVTVVTGLVKLMKFVYDSAVGYQAKMFQAGKDLGLNVTESTRLFKNFQGIAASNGQLAMTARQLVETYAQVNNTLGVMGPRNAEFLTTTTGIQRRIGATAEDMQAFQFYSVATGKSLAQGYSSIIGSAKAQGARLKIAMTEKQIMESIGKVSATIFNNFKGNVQKIAEAVVKATKLGLSLDQVQQAGYQLLDFESSISKEFEAQLLTGKNINLSRARQLALTGSTEELMEEITSQLGSQAEWNKMNVIQQQSLAEAMGMNKEAVDEMYKKQQLVAVLGAQAGASSKTQYDLLIKQGKTHDEISQLLGDRAASDALAASVQDKMAATMERIRDAIGEMTARFLPLIEKFANFVSNADNLRAIFKTVAGIMAGLVSVSVALSIQKRIQLQAQVQEAVLQRQNLVLQTRLAAIQALKNKDAVKAIGLQNLQAAAEGRTAALSAAGSAAKIAGGSSYLGPLALGVGLAAFAGLMAMISSVGGPSGGGGGGNISVPEPDTGMEPVNKEAEVVKSNEPRKIGMGQVAEPKYYILQVDPITGNKMERQVTKEYYESQGGQFKNN